MSTVLTAQEPSAKYLVNLQPPLVRHFDLIAQAPGGVACLRELILTLAVQGKLVPQDPSDEPASELLKKIRAEKDRLIAEGKIKRDKPLAGVADEEKPFELPQGWQWIRLGSLLPFRIGKTPPSKDPQYWGSEGYDWVSISDMEHFGEVENTQRKITPLGASLFGYEPLPAGTLIMSFKLTIGKIAVLRTPAYHNEAIVSFHPITGLDTEFLKYTLPAVSKTGASKNALMGQTLNTESLSNLIMAVPPTAEQSRIVTRVEELMELCDTLEASGQLEAQQHAQLVNTLLDTLTQSETPEALADNWQRIATHFDVLLDRPEAVDALEQTILQLAVRGLLVPQNPSDEPASSLLQKIRTEKDHLIVQGKIKRDKPLPPIIDEEKPFKLPQGWEWARLNDLIRIGSGDGLTAAQMAPTGTIPVYGGNGVNGHHDQANVEEPTLVIGRVGYYCGSVHITPAKAWVTDNAFITRHPKSHLEMEWLYWLLVGTNLKENDSATAQPVISGRKLYPIVVALPPYAEQSRIVTRIKELRALCVDLRQSLIAAQSTQSHLADALVAA